MHIKIKEKTTPEGQEQNQRTPPCGFPVLLVPSHCRKFHTKILMPLNGDREKLFFTISFRNLTLEVKPSQAVLQPRVPKSQQIPCGHLHRGGRSQD